VGEGGGEKRGDKCVLVVREGRLEEYSWFVVPFTVAQERRGAPMLTVIVVPDLRCLTGELFVVAIPQKALPPASANKAHHKREETTTADRLSHLILLHPGPEDRTYPVGKRPPRDFPIPRTINPWRSI